MVIPSCCPTDGNGDFGDEVVIATTDNKAECVTLSSWLDSERIPHRWRSEIFRNVQYKLVVKERWAKEAQEAVDAIRQSEADPEDLERQAMESLSEYEAEEAEPAAEELPEEESRFGPANFRAGDEIPGLRLDTAGVVMSSQVGGPHHVGAGPTVPVAIVGALFLTFGTGHRYAGARFRAGVLAVVELTAIILAFYYQSWELLIPAGLAILFDAVGGSVQILANRKSTRGARPGL